MENKQDWQIELLSHHREQRYNEDNYGYVNKRINYVVKEPYLQVIYAVLYAKEYDKHKSLFSSKQKKTIKDIENMFIRNNEGIKLFTILEEKGRMLNHYNIKNKFIKHLFAVGYNKISNDSLTNINNLKKGLPVIICTEEGHYLLLPEDFGYTTKFFNDQEDHKYTKETLLHNIYT